MGVTDASGCRVRTVGGKKEIFDPVRRRFVSLTPEESVRQAYLLYLTQALHFPLISLSVEKKVVYNGQTRRYDIVAYRPDAKALLLVECKAEQVPLSGDTLYQAAMYNHELQADFVVLFNGVSQFACRREAQGYQPLGNLPAYKEMLCQSDALRREKRGEEGA